MHRRIDSYIVLRRMFLPFWAAARIVMVVGLLLSWMALSAHAAAPAVTNISPQQRAGTKLVDITYDVSAVTPTVSVSLRISADDGATFTVPAASLSGAIGAGVSTGTGKVITWNAGADWAQNYSTTMRFEVTADDGLTPPSITTQPNSSTLVSGSTAHLTVAANGTEPLTYQWYQGSVGDTTTPVGTNSVSFTPPALTADVSYWVRVSNAAGTVDSILASEMAFIPAGEFQMGDTFAEADTQERPVHTVNVSAFYMGKYEVTNSLWHNVRTYGLANGYTDLPTGEGKGANHPVYNINWYDMVKWCNARSQKDGLSPCYKAVGLGSVEIYKTGENDAVTCNWNANGYRLPTEAEWEKAARGGKSGKRFPWGDTISHIQANFRNEGGEAYQTGTSGYHPTYVTGSTPYTSPVGAFAANDYGLHDMAGNVREWVWDWYGSNYYASSPSVDPRGSSRGSSANTIRLIRGGGSNSLGVSCRVAGRSFNTSTSDSYKGTGFRIARSLIP